MLSDPVFPSVIVFQNFCLPEHGGSAWGLPNKPAWLWQSRNFWHSDGSIGVRRSQTGPARHRVRR